jgi:phage terminase large subunit-like protein
MVLTQVAKRQLVAEATKEAMRRIEHGIYVPYGTCADVFYSQDTDIIISGPAGTGKSRACLEKIHFHALNYPGSRYLIVRKTRKSLSEAALQTFEDWVLGSDHPMLYKAPQRQFRHSYRYENGSQVVVGGMDKPSRIMSTEFDFIFVQEAIEINKDDWDALGTRLRNNVVPFQQLIADTNPSYSGHWIHKRAENQRLELLHSEHTDNPTLYDQEKKEWTENGLAYLERLDKLTGVLKKRYRFGQWTADDPKASWSRDQIDHVTKIPELSRIVVAIDPAATTGQTGIIVAGKAKVEDEWHAYILEDSTPAPGVKPDVWGAAAVTAYHKLEADRILGEVNHGGDMIYNVIKNVPNGRGVPYSEVRASRGKKARSEPVQALYVGGRVHHVGHHEPLEDEMCNYVEGESNWSPNRMDAMVWAVTDLLLIGTPNMALS